MDVIWKGEWRESEPAQRIWFVLCAGVLPVCFLFSIFDEVRFNKIVIMAAFAVFCIWLFGWKEHKSIGRLSLTDRFVVTMGIASILTTLRASDLMADFQGLEALVVEPALEAGLYSGNSHYIFPFRMGRDGGCDASDSFHNCSPTLSEAGEVVAVDYWRSCRGCSFTVHMDIPSGQPGQRNRRDAERTDQVLDICIDSDVSGAPSGFKTLRKWFLYIHRYGSDTCSNAGISSA